MRAGLTVGLGHGCDGEVGEFKDEACNGDVRKGGSKELRGS